MNVSSEGLESRGIPVTQRTILNPPLDYERDLRKEGDREGSKAVKKSIGRHEEKPEKAAHRHSLLAARRRQKRRDKHQAS